MRKKVELQRPMALQGPGITVSNQNFEPPSDAINKTHTYYNFNNNVT